MGGTKGVAYIAFGLKAKREAEGSIKALRRSGSYPIVVTGDQEIKGVRWVRKEIPPGMSPAQASRVAKVTLWEWIPFEYVCYLDADCWPHFPIEAGFQILEDGWDLVITPSANQGKDLLWHLGPKDREATLLTWGFGSVLQLQAGMFFAHRTPRVEQFFACWLTEWERFLGQDQGAFLRALKKVPLSIWLLGRPWNGGAVIAHRFGRVGR